MSNVVDMAQWAATRRKKAPMTPREAEQVRAWQRIYNMHAKAGNKRMMAVAMERISRLKGEPHA